MFDYDTRSLAPLVQHLNQAGFALRELSQPYPQIEVSLHEHPAVDLQLFYEEERLLAVEPQNKALAAELAGSTTLCFVWQQICSFPDARLPLYRLINQASQRLPFGAFGVDENESMLYFRYVLPQSERHREDWSAIEVLESLRFYLSSLIPQVLACVAEPDDIEGALSDLEPIWAQQLWPS